MGEPARSPIAVVELDALRSIIREELRAVASAAPRSDEWMSADDVARMLGVARTTLPALVSRDGLPCYRPGKGYAFRRTEIEAWLLERRNRPGARRRRAPGG